MATRQCLGLRLGPLILALLLTACSGPGITYISRSPSITESPTPTVVPTISGATGQYGRVEVNMTFIDDLTGLSVTIQQANTTWVQALYDFDGPVPPDTWRMTGLRIAVDTTGAAALGVQLFNADPTDSGNDIFLTSPDNTHTANCYYLWRSGMDEKHRNAFVAAVGGDVPFKLDTATGRGAGWIVCDGGETGVFDGAYTVNMGYFGGVGPDGLSIVRPPIAWVTIAP